MRGVLIIDLRKLFADHHLRTRVRVRALVGALVHVRVACGVQRACVRACALRARAVRRTLTSFARLNDSSFVYDFSTLVCPLMLSPNGANPCEPALRRSRHNCAAAAGIVPGCHCRPKWGRIGEVRACVRGRARACV